MKQIIRILLSFVFISFLVNPMINAGKNTGTSSNNKNMAQLDSTQAAEKNSQSPTDQHGPKQEANGTSGDGKYDSQTKEKTVFTQPNMNTLLIAIVISVLFFRIIKGYRRRKAVANKPKSTTNAEKIKALEFVFKTNITDLNNKIIDLDNKIKERNEKLETIIRNQEDKHKIDTRSITADTTSSTKVIDGYIGINKGNLFNEFYDINNDKCFFKIQYNSDSKTATFSLIELARIKSMMNILNEAITIDKDSTVSIAKANNCVELSRGTLKKGDGQTWRIESKLIIKLTD